MTMPPDSKKQILAPSEGSATKAGADVLTRLKDFKGAHNAVVGLSGGVDSSLTLALLAEAGWKVEGLTLWLMNGKGSCCSDGLIDAAGICEQLGIRHHVIDSRELFQKEIIESVVESYQEGITPIPCSRCNRSVKFSEMLSWIKKESKFNHIATGHYARIRKCSIDNSAIKLPGDSTNRNKLLRGLDKNKDQSYFLYDLSQELLDNIIFPLGELTKEDTRKEALRLGLRTAKKPESQDLCLAELHGSMRNFLDNYLPPIKGKITLKDGTILGEHNGIQHYTIGQRKGLGISWKEPLHVVSLDAAFNRVIVAPRKEAGRLSCVIGCVNWISISPPKDSIKVDVQIRYRSKPVRAELTPLEPTKDDINNQRPFRCKLTFLEEQFSIAPGQAAVFYFGEFVLGGGIIMPLKEE